MALTVVVLLSLFLHLVFGHSDICPTPPAAGVSYRFVIRNPPNCVQSDCTFFAELRTNDNNSLWLDYYMEGSATGYLALGWNNVSQTQMSDIIACAYNNQTRAVQVVDTWVDQNNAVVTDANRAYLCNQSIGTYGNGRMSCSYSRSYSTHDTLNDYRIDGLFYFLYGQGNSIPSVGGNNTLTFTTNYSLTVSNITINPRWYPATAAPTTVAPTTATVSSSSIAAVQAHLLVLFLITAIAALSLM